MSITREYRCKCGEIIIDKVSIKKPLREECPKCGGKLKHVMGTPEFYRFDDPHRGMTGHRMKGSRHG